MNLTGCEIRFVLWARWPSDRVEPYKVESRLSCESVYGSNEYFSDWVLSTPSQARFNISAAISISYEDHVSSLWVID